MPENPVTDPITDQEIAFAHLILSGAMDDSRAAEAVGLNPATAADTKSKPAVRAYIHEHRAALGRDRILVRLWQLADFSPVDTRGSIASQVKAMCMIAAIEGVIPDRRFSKAQPATPPPVKAKIYEAEPMRRQREAEAAAAEKPVAPPPAEPPAAGPAPNPSLSPTGINWVPDATGPLYQADVHPTGPFRLPASLRKGTNPRGR